MLPITLYNFCRFVPVPVLEDIVVARTQVVHSGAVGAAWRLLVALPMFSSVFQQNEFGRLP